MENSRKPAPIDAPAGTSTDAVSNALARWLAAQHSPLHARWAIAFSGGRDSTVLLHALSQLIDTAQLAALHVHHGLQNTADEWQQHCRDLCAQLNIPFFTRNISVPRDSGLGIEAAARQARYAALVEMAREARCDVLLTAHHADDQVESVLLQLLRGTGLAGASGMAASKSALHSEFPQQRPLLKVPVAALAEYAVAHQLCWVEDPSNRDTHYARNALRHSVLPALEKYFPNYRNTLNRFAQHAAQAQGLLEELAHLDYLLCQSGAESLNTKQLLKLSPARQANLLRYWLTLHELAMPTEARLQEVRRRLQQAKQVSAWSVTHEGHEIRFEYGMLSVRSPSQKINPPETIDFRWQGETEIAMPAWGGKWKFILAEQGKQGVDAHWLREQILSTRPRQPEVRLKVHPQRPSRSLKNLYQEAQIPHDVRTRLPLLFVQNEVLVAAGLGMACRFVATRTGPAVCIAWELG